MAHLEIVRALTPLVLVLSLAAPGSSLAGGQAPANPEMSPGSGDEPSAAFPQPSPSVARRIGEIYERMSRSPAAEERRAALRELVDIGPEAIPLMLAELDRKSRATWAATAYALGASGDSRVIPALERELSRQRGKPYMDLLYALALAGEPTALQRALRSTNANVIFDLSATAVDYIAAVLGPASVPDLIREIPRRSLTGRQAGLGALGTVSDASAVGFLIRWSRRDQPVDRRFAIIGLARIGDPRAVPRMIEALDDDDARVRHAAIEGLGYLRARDAVPNLIAILKEPESVSARGAAAWSLGLIGGPGVSKALREAWSGSKAQDQALLLQALGKLRDPDAVPLLTRIAQSPDPLSIEAARALAEIEGMPATDALLEACNAAVSLDTGLELARELAVRADPRALPCVLRWLKEEIDLRHRLSPISEEILSALPRTAPRSSATSLDSLAEEIAAPALAHRVRATAQSVRLVNELGLDIDPWLSLLETGTPHEVELAIAQLGALGDPRAVAPLRRLFGQIEPSRAYVIPRALAEIRSDRATPFLIELLTDDLYDVPHLERARVEAALALARCTGEEHVAQALREAFVSSRGRLFVALAALARVRGPEGIDEIVELKSLLMRERGATQVLRHERANWYLRLLRSGRQIPLEEVKDVR